MPRLQAKSFANPDNVRTMPRMTVETVGLDDVLLVGGEQGAQLGAPRLASAQVVGRVVEQGREAGDKVQEVAGNIKGAVDKSVKDQPMATLAMAAVLGFVLGAIWKA